jgi:hypothetical protein
MECMVRKYKKIIWLISLFVVQSCQFKDELGIKVNLFSGEIYCENEAEKIEWIYISSICSDDFLVLLIFENDSIRNKINFKQELLYRDINPDSLFNDCSRYGFSIHTITKGSSPVPYEFSFEVNQLKKDTIIRFDYMRM